MNSPEVETCPRCGETMERGFSARAAGLSFIAPEKFNRYAFLDEDIAQAGLRK